MRKFLASAAALSIIGNYGYAFENDYAGFTLKDYENSHVFQTKNAYGYIINEDLSLRKLADKKILSSHLIVYYEPQEFEEITKEKFSTQYFDEQYEKLALLERSGLNITMFDIGILKFLEHDSDTKNMLFLKKLLKNSEDGASLESKINIGKHGKYKTVTTSYRYRKHNDLNALDITMLSFNNKLFLLHSFYTEQDFFASEDDTDTSILNRNSHKISNVDAQDIDDETRNKIDEAHNNFVKTLKQIKPTAEKQQLYFYDKNLKKNIQLPQDWFYTQLKINEKEASGHVTLAANIAKAWQEPYVTRVYELYSKDNKNNGLHTEMKNDDKIDSHAKFVLDVLDSAVLIVSFKSDEAASILDEALVKKSRTELLLKEAMENMKNSDSERFSLKNYDLSVNASEKKFILKVNSQISFYKNYDYDLKSNFFINDKYGSIFMYMNRKNGEIDPAINKLLTEYNF